MITFIQIISTILGLVAVGFIAYFASSLKRFIISVFVAFIISIAVYTGLELGFGTMLPVWLIPIFMIIATIIELRREASKEEQKNLPNRQSE